MADIKNLLDDITKDIDSSYPEDDSSKVATTTDIGSFREKLSLYVLKDIVCHMLDQNTDDDVDGMVDKAIMKHIRDNYDGSCYGYLCHARDRLASPEMNLFGSIVQEIDGKCASIIENCQKTKTPIQESTSKTAKELLEGVENYNQFTDKLTKEVSQNVVDDVVEAISKSSKAPVFEDIDEKVKVIDKPEPVINPNGTRDPEDDVTSESYILNTIANIVTESAIEGNPISMSEAYDKAFIEYAIYNMDMLTRACPKIKLKK